MSRICSSIYNDIENESDDGSGIFSEKLTE